MLVLNEAITCPLSSTTEWLVVVEQTIIYCTQNIPIRWLKTYDSNVRPNQFKIYLTGM